MRERAVKDETGHPIRKCGCESESDAATARVTDDVSLLDVQRFEEQQQVLRLRAFVGKPRRFSESARVVADDPVSRLERRNLIVPDAHVVGPPVNENDGRPLPRYVVIDGGITNVERARLRTETSAN